MRRDDDRPPLLMTSTTSTSKRQFVHLSHEGTVSYPLSTGLDYYSAAHQSSALRRVLAAAETPMTSCSSQSLLPRRRSDRRRDITVAEAATERPVDVDDDTAVLYLMARMAVLMLASPLT